MGDLGWFLIVSGVIVVLFARRDLVRAIRMAMTRTKPIRDTSPGDRVEIVGRIVAAAETLSAPISNERAVWCRVLHETYERSGSKTRWYPSGRGEHGVPFLVDDGSGVTARVLPGHIFARDLLPRRSLSRAAPEAANVFIDEHLVRDAQPVNTQFVDDDPPRLGAQRWIEDLLAPGDTIYVLGAARQAVDGKLELDGAPELLIGAESEGKTAFGMRGLLFYALALIAAGAALLVFSR